MSKHTPGPWLSRGKSDSVHESSDTHPYGCQIFRFADDQGPSDDDLNLILSAPDLLEALEHMLNVCPTIDSSGEEAREKALAIVARAKGETVIAKESTTPAHDCWFCDGTKEYQGQPCLICVEQKS